MAILNLAWMPAEILLCIAQFLRTHDLNSTCQVSRRFYNVLSSILYDRAVHHIISYPEHHRLCPRPEYHIPPGIPMLHARSYVIPPDKRETTPLIWAVTNGQDAVLQRLIERGVDPSKRIGGTTALHEAIFHDRLDVLQQLLELGKKTSTPGYVSVVPESLGGMPITPLVAATRRNDINAVQILLHYGAGSDIEIIGEWHLAMSDAINKGYTDVCLLLVDSAARNSRIPSGSVRVQQSLDMLFRTAALCGLLPVLKALLQLGANINGADRSGDTPLHWAILKPHVLPWLLEAGANGKAVNGRAQTPLDVAIQGDQTQAFRALLGHMDPSTREALESLRLAVKMNRYGVIKDLAGAGVPINAPIENTRTALHLAIDVSYGRSLRALLDCGADTSVVTAGNLTPLHLATAAYREVPVQMLLDAGADISARSLIGDTCLHIATRGRMRGLADIVVEASQKWGIELFTTRGSGYTVLETAARYGDTYMVELLLKIGVDVHQHGDHSTALHEAIMRRRRDDIAKLLLEHGADPYRLDLYGRSAFDWAALQPSLSRLVLKYAKGGYTPPTLEERTAILRRSVVTIATRIANGSRMHSDFSRLGRCLIFLSNGPVALTAFAHEVSPPFPGLLMGEGMDEISELSCVSCGRDPKARVGVCVCVSCGMSVLCDTCKRQYGPGKACTGHQFVNIPKYTRAPLPTQGVKDSSHLEIWLERLLATYS